MRRNIVRYAVLSYVITLQRVSLRVKKRFPTWQHVVDSGKSFSILLPIIISVSNENYNQAHECNETSNEKQNI